MKALFNLILLISTLNMYSQKYGIHYSNKTTADNNITNLAKTHLPQNIVSDTDNLWQSIPLEGGEMTSIAMNPKNNDIIFVGTRDAGIFKTENGGETWFPTRNGLTFYPIRCLAINPKNPFIIFAGTDYNGIWKSTDNGKSWKKTGFDGKLIVFNIIINPKNPQIMYVGTAGGVGLNIGHIYKTQNGGETWEIFDNGLPHENNSEYTNGIFSLAIDKSNPNVIYSGTNYLGIYKTIDSGKNWTVFNDSIPERTSWPDHYPSINAIAINSSKQNQPSILSRGVFYEYNGNYWEKTSKDYVFVGESIGPGKLYHLPTNSQIVYTNVDYSVDGGKNWEKFVTFSNSEERHSIVDVVVPDPNFRTIIAATEYLFATKGGVIKTKNRGASWNYSSNGINCQNIRSVTVDVNNHNKIYAGTGSGHFYGSNDGGNSWKRGYLGDENNKSFDFSKIIDISINPLNKNEIFMVSGLGFYKSIDGGITFVKKNNSYPISMTVISDSITTIYLGGSSLGILKSIDGGETWESKNKDLPFDFGNRIKPITSITIDPNNHSIVWAGTQFHGGIFKSNDGGENWENLGLLNDGVIRSITINPNNSDEILVGCSDFKNKIFKSIDGGKNWELFSDNLAAVYTFVYDPRDSKIVYAATKGFGIIRSNDGGENWGYYNSGIFYPLTYSLAITHEEAPFLITGSYASGLYYTYPPEKILSFDSEIKNVTCYDECDGSIEISDIQNGTPPFKYVWSNWKTTKKIDDLCNGTYTVTVTDADNFLSSNTFEITQPDEIIFQILSKKNIEANQPGYIYIKSGNYTFNWSGPNGFTANTKDINNLTNAGCYNLIITDESTTCSIDTTICIENTSSVLDLESNSVNIHPIPAKESFVIDFDKTKLSKYTISIFDLSGNKILETEKQENKNKLIINSNILHNGYYILRFKSKSSLPFYKRIIIDK